MEEKISREIYYSVAPEIFRRFPGYVRGVVIGSGVANGPSPAALLEQLGQAQEALRGRLDPGRLAEEPRIACWREAYRSFGAKPSEFRSSVEAMARRVLRGESLPAINGLVDIGNLVSLRHLAPAGSHAIDVLTGDIELRPAGGDETFVPFGSEAAEHPLPGEIIFAEGKTVLTRRWTWRQARHTLTLPGTRAVEFNVDGLPPVPPTEIEEACREIEALASRFCGGAWRHELLRAEQPRLLLVSG